MHLVYCKSNLLYSCLAEYNVICHSSPKSLQRTGFNFVGSSNEGGRSLELAKVAKLTDNQIYLNPVCYDYIVNFQICFSFLRKIYVPGKARTVYPNCKSFAKGNDFRSTDTSNLFQCHK